MSASNELARRAVAAWTECGLGWMPGMAMTPSPDDDVGPRVVAVQEDQRWLSLDDGDEIPDDLDGLAPDLDDPATLGCIEHGMLPEAWPGTEVSIKRWQAESGETMADVYVHERSGACSMLFGVFEVPLADGLVACLEAAAERRRS